MGVLLVCWAGGIPKHLFRWIGTGCNDLDSSHDVHKSPDGKSEMRQILKTCN